MLTVSTLAADISPEIDGIIKDLAQRIYNGEEITYDPELLRETAQTYMKAVGIGYGRTLDNVEWNSPDFLALEKIAQNVFKFSASKNYNTLRDMTLLLKDGNSIRSFEDFSAEVDKINIKYNHNWLRTEYNQAVASSQCAARWTDYGKRAENNPYLQYQAVMDANTRAEHAALNGVIKRYDDDFWDKYYPPNGWGCRCEVVQLPGKNHKETPDADLKYCKVDPMFQVNVGKSGKVFSEEHPYFMQRCRNCRTQLGTPDPNNPQCQACQYGMAQCRTFVEDCKIKAEKRKWEDIANDKNYKPIKGEKNIYAPEGRSTEKDFNDKLTTARIAVEHGYRVWILGKTGKRNPDYLFERGGIFHPYDLKRVQSINSLEQDLVKSQGQTNRVVIKMNRTGNPRIIIKSIRKYFEQVTEAQEVLIFQGKRPISIERNFFERNKKSYIKDFLKLWK